MYSSSSELTSLISSRICHDLASPLGAIANGLELLELTGFSDTPEAALLSDSVRHASARIDFFRIAFGPAAEDGQIAPTVADRTLSQIYNDRRITVSWSPTTPVARPIAKLMFLLVQAVETAIPYGGQIEIDQSPSGWSIKCTAKEIRFEDDLWAHLTSSAPSKNLQSSQVQFGLARVLLDELGHSLKIEKSENTISISIR